MPGLRRRAGGAGRFARERAGVYHARGSPSSGTKAAGIPYVPMQHPGVGVAYKQGTQARRPGSFPVNRFDQIEYASLTDVGVRRSHNQDNLAVQLAADDAQWRQRGHLFLVADGMGAHAVGEKASEQAAGVIPHTFVKHAQQGPPGAALRKAFIEANAHIHACGQPNREFEGMGTTTTALLLRPEGAWVGHVGDSRVYRIRDGWIEQLSYDHSLLWEYARIKHMDPEDVPGHPQQRHPPLPRAGAVGPGGRGGTAPVEAGDVFLLCSDGLSGQVTDSEMGAVATVLPPAEACRFLVDLANLRGGPDNITALIVRIPPGPEANGAPASSPRKPRRLPRPAWWLLALAGGALLASRRRRDALQQSCRGRCSSSCWRRSPSSPAWSDSGCITARNRSSRRTNRSRPRRRAFTAGPPAGSRRR